MEKPQLINFIAKVLEDSGFKVYKNFKTSQRVIDIYAVLPTTIGDFGVVMACNNYDKEFEVGIDVLKEMEDAAESLKASKVAVVTSAYFNSQATNYALRKNIKLVDRDKLTELAKRYQDNSQQTTLDSNYSTGDVSYVEEDYPEYTYDASDMEYIMRRRDENPVVYKNTLYPQVEEYNSRKSPFSFLDKYRNRQRNNSYPADLYGYNYSSGPTWFDRLQPILSNPFVTIALVVIISYLLSYLFGNVLKIDYGISGLIEMIVALLLSYGLTFIFADRSRFFITRGTVIFFISLIILIILIFI
ncbi:MAG: restriction endonuclease [Methanobrevibacter sp.]|uniref:Restriction endonuclease n=1 Tax=Methanobrevibacter millerae TaxID=230361 RepID=A0A8T3VGG4_9EURY|nr:restriction endonuclease [Methanobrevibacter sp.]MBE6509667.1 restriction endonuclease [Methanobrevibacter millerae]MBO5152158.1 restriction endonuclease [Methanobrevibacter sp.]